MSSKSHIVAGSFTPLKNNVFVADLDSGPRITYKGIIIPDDNMTGQGVRSRWGRVHSVGPDVTDLAPGDWILIEHGRWTLAIDIEIAGKDERLWRVDYPAAVLLAADTDPRDAQPHTFR